MLVESLWRRKKPLLIPLRKSSEKRKRRHFWFIEIKKIFIQEHRNSNGLTLKIWRVCARIRKLKKLMKNMYSEKENPFYIRPNSSLRRFLRDSTSKLGSYRLGTDSYIDSALIGFFLCSLRILESKFLKFYENGNAWSFWTRSSI